MAAAPHSLPGQGVLSVRAFNIFLSLCFFLVSAAVSAERAAQPMGRNSAYL